MGISGVCSTVKIDTQKSGKDVLEIVHHIEFQKEYSVQICFEFFGCTIESALMEVIVLTLRDINKSAI
jgi:hypothetical protein